MDRGMISVDSWSDGSQAYFLTHLHADHTAGLSRAWKRCPLFCSRVTARLFPVKFPGFDLSVLRILDIGRWHTHSLVSPISGSEVTFEVMAIDAHHCPGAVMYLFRGEFGCMLYTGDFRWELETKRAQIGRNMLLDAVKNEQVGILYLDNTFCNPSYSFPSREVAAQQVVNIIMSYPDHDIIIAIDTLGKEDLLLYISRVLKIKIRVWPERLQIMHLLGLPDVFTTDTSLTRVRAVPRYSFSIDTIQGLNTMRPTIGIMPSGLPWVEKTLEENDDVLGSSPLASNSKKANSGTSINRNEPNGHSTTVKRYHQLIYSVPYSDHSCFPEIQHFVKLLQPTKIKGIVSLSTSYVDPWYYFGHLCGAYRHSSCLYEEVGGEEGGETVQAAQIKKALGRSSSAEVKRERRTSQVAWLDGRTSWMSLLRRISRGSKIVEIDCP